MKKVLVPIIMMLCATTSWGGTIVRGTKSGTGTTEFGAGTVILSGELNTDFNRAFNEINGALDNANIDSSAGIDPTKLDDASATSTDHLTQTSPGSHAAETLPTTLEGEVEQLRYAIARAAGVLNAERTDSGGQDTVNWIENAVMGPNLIANPNFMFDESITSGAPPGGWTEKGTLDSSSIQSDAAGFGGGQSVTFNTPATANVGLSQTITNLEPDTRYLIFVRAFADGSGDGQIAITGADATGAWRPHTEPITAEVAPSDYNDYVIVVETDATPTDIVIAIESAAATDTDIDVKFVGMWELGVNPRPQRTAHRFYEISNSDSGKGAACGVYQDITTVTVDVPSTGYVVRFNFMATASQAASGCSGVCDHSWRVIDPSSTQIGGLFSTSENDSAGIVAPTMVNVVDTSPSVGSQAYKIQFCVGASDNLTNWSVVTRGLAEVVPAMLQGQ